MTRGKGDVARRYLRMWAEAIGHPRFFIYALLLHVAAFALLVVSLNWAPTLPPPPPKVNIVEAVVIDESKVQAELEKLRRAEDRKRQQEAARQQQLSDKAKAAEEARRAEERRLAELQRKQEQAELKVKKEQERLAEEQKRVAQEQQRARELELQQRLESERLAKLKAEQAALERKKREEERQREAERLRQQQIAEEQQRLEQEWQKHVASEKARYIDIIRQKVSRNWIRVEPQNASGELSCNVLVKLMPGGEVADVRITKGSGDPAFDRSVTNAVFKATPLPLPEDVRLFNEFREIEFTFNPYKTP